MRPDAPDRAGARRRRRRLPRRRGDLRRGRARGLPRLGPPARGSRAPATRSSADGSASSSGSAARSPPGSSSRRSRRSCSRCRPPSVLARTSRTVRVGDTIAVEELAAWLVERGMTPRRGGRGRRRVQPARRDPRRLLARRGRAGPHRVLRRRGRVDPPVRPRDPALARPLGLGHADRHARRSTGDDLADSGHLADCLPRGDLGRARRAQRPAGGGAALPRPRRTTRAGSTRSRARSPGW